ncbi:hypothetical protein ACJ73_10302 [Blastomyces percursus]|uniref:Uncharacterized protein n=1 Tax=Blastomyces percursus TaxID=1658174 RepID=A0A1J9Q0H2_9EURO|nr:hypothetical protein ACJ73_10302 [Blastomyces percursus]
MAWLSDFGFGESLDSRSAIGAFGRGKSGAFIERQLEKLLHQQSAQRLPSLTDRRQHLQKTPRLLTSTPGTTRKKGNRSPCNTRMQHRARVTIEHTPGSERELALSMRMNTNWSWGRRIVDELGGPVSSSHDHCVPRYSLVPSAAKQLSVRFADIPRQSTESWAWAWQAMRRRDTALGYKDARPTFPRGANASINTSRRLSEGGILRPHPSHVSS